MSNLIAVTVDWEQYGFTGGEKKIAQREWDGVLAGRRNVQFGLLEMGEHLTKLRALMEGKGCWVKFCTDLKVFGYKTVRRYINNYERVRAAMHPWYIQAAITEGVELFSPSDDPERPFGPYQEAYLALPPAPSPESPQAAKEYVLSLRDYVQKHPPRHRRGVRGVSGERKAVQAFQMARNAYKSISDDKRRRHKWAVQYIGMLMHEFGLPAQQMQPEAPPIEYVRGPGRPTRK